ncbi:MAG: cytochrome c [Verrucomicrobiae bacterium]|nr:cytochrome c [Verrucomicrobiae bacterium]
MRNFLLALAIVLFAALAAAGWRGRKSERPPLQIFPDMKSQPKYKTQAETPFFADARADRVPVSGTIPVEIDPRDAYRLTGKIRDRWGDGFPVKVTSALLERGRQRFGIYCAPCHGLTGSGDGVVTEYALKGVVANFNSDRLRNLADGQIFWTIANGKGQMMGYPHIAADDRWAIVAWVRTLQLSQAAPLADATEAERSKWRTP